MKNTAFRWNKCVLSLLSKIPDKGKDIKENICFLVCSVLYFISERMIPYNIISGPNVVRHSFRHSFSKSDCNDVIKNLYHVTENSEHFVVS